MLIEKTEKTEKLAKDVVDLLRENNANTFETTCNKTLTPVLIAINEDAMFYGLVSEILSTESKTNLKLQMLVQEYFENKKQNTCSECDNTNVN